VRQLLLFANPISGSGRSKAIAGLITRKLRREGYQVQVHYEPADQIAPDQLTERARAAIVIGGDGTLRTVANRLMTVTHPPPLIPVPMGTANLMARQLRLPRITMDSAANFVGETLRGAKVVRYDVARVNLKLCLLMAGIGYDGEIVHDLAKSRVGPINYASYLLPAARALGSYKFHALRVLADGKEVFPSRPAIAFVGNSREYGIGFPVLPQADPHDGLLDLCVLPCRSRTELFQWFVGILTGTHLLGKGVVTTRAKHFFIESSQPVPVQVDGDAAGHTPVSIDLLPAQLGFMVPASKG
jgi:diacylglycerol kinase (ATP)